MIQYAALLGAIQDGLSDIHHPIGNRIYLVRNDQEIVYIGQTVLGEWDMIRRHLRARKKFGLAALALGCAAAHWRVEVCNFGGEPGTPLLKGELIRRYRPTFNELYNAERPRTEGEQLELRYRATLGPAYIKMLDDGWPSFCDVALEELHAYPPRARRRNPLGHTL